MNLPQRPQDMMAWLLDDARQISDPRTWIATLGEALHHVGTGLDRIWIGTPVLHPQTSAIGWLWQRGQPIEQSARPNGFERTQAFLQSPGGVILHGELSVRSRLEQDPQPRFLAMRELQAAGATDYFAQRLDTQGKVVAAVAWSTHRPGGFCDEDIALLDTIRPIVALELQLFLQELRTQGLLHAYLGVDAGERVLRGQVKRGDGDTVRAVVCFGDLRGFTSLSERLPRQALLDLLNDHFEAITAAVEAQGGVVLKFIGDGILAIFPATDDEPDACRRAMAATADVAVRVAACNEARQAQGRELVRYGLALHIGEVQYGNIGAPGRLDFTVIGPAVNLTARLEGLAAHLGRPVVVSAAFAQACGQPLQSLGAHAVKGIADPVEVFAP